MTMPLLIEHRRPISIRFSDTLLPDHRLSEDEVSNAIARTAKCGLNLAIDCRRKRFSAGSYFACNAPIPEEDILRTYVEQEHVFPDRETASTFLRMIGKSPKQSRYIHLSAGVIPEADVVVLIVRAEEAGKILGLAAALGQLVADVIPAAPTCAALYRPLIAPDRIHVNFIDYFDREMQAKEFYDASELLVSMTPSLYRKLLTAAHVSAHGYYTPQDIPAYHAELLSHTQSTEALPPKKKEKRMKNAKSY